MAVAGLLAAWLVARDGLFFLLIAVAIVKAAAKDAPCEPDRGALWSYAGVSVALAVVFRFTEAVR